MQVYFCQGAGGAHRPPSLGPASPGTPTLTISCQGPRGRVSAQPGAFSPCPSHVVGVLVSGPVSWMGLGPPLQRAALLDGALRPRSELVRHNSGHNIAERFCPSLVYSIPCTHHESNNSETVICLKCQGGFSSKNTFNDT